MLKILDWYIIKKLITTTVFIVIIFSVIAGVVDSSEKADDFVKSGQIRILYSYTIFCWFHCVHHFPDISVDGVHSRDIVYIEDGGKIGDRGNACRRCKIQQDTEAIPYRLDRLDPSYKLRFVVD